MQEDDINAMAEARRARRAQVISLLNQMQLPTNMREFGTDPEAVKLVLIKAKAKFKDLWHERLRLTDGIDSTDDILTSK